MTAYIVRRLFATLPVMAVVALFVFFLLRLAPGDPAAIIAGEDATASSGPDAGTGTSGDAGDAGDASTGPTAGSSDASGDASDDRAADVDAVEPDGGAAPKLVPPPPTGAGTASEGSLEAAIADGRIRELGDLLVLGTGPSTVTWDAATSRCGRRKVGGLGNWRLPTKGQLAELRRAKLLAPGSYWSRSTVASCRCGWPCSRPPSAPTDA